MDQASYYQTESKDMKLFDKEDARCASLCTVSAAVAATKQEDIIKDSGWVEFSLQDLPSSVKEIRRVEEEPCAR